MNQKSGIALDIDDTLSDTLNHFTKLLQEKFPNPEGLTREEVVKKYRIVPNMPFWQTPEVKEWLDAQAVSNEAQEAVAVIAGAPEIVAKINTVVPVRMYITSRPSIVAEGRERWLKKYGFPPAELITRPHSKMKIDGNAWKAAILKERYPEIIGIVDDNPEIIKALGSDYQGTVFLFGDHYPAQPDGGAHFIHCPTWDDVAIAIDSLPAKNATI
jgi:hypothetical protein